MADVKFTEKELGFINDCTVDKKGNIVSMLAKPFPSLYRKGVIEKRKDHFVVGKEFRDMFYREDQVVDLTIPEVEHEDEPVAVETEEAPAPITHAAVPAFDWPSELPADLSEFRIYLGNVLKVGSTKGAEDEFMFIDTVKDVFEFTRKTIIQNGEGVSSEYGTALYNRRGWRKRLGEICAAYYGVGHRVDNAKDTYFEGEGYMASACEFTYKYLLVLGNRMAQRHYDTLLAAGGESKGSYYKKVNEFLDEVTKRFDVWTDARMVRDPETGEVIGEMSGEYAD